MLASDHRIYFVKSAQNFRETHAKQLAVEFVVARLAASIHAPVPESSLIRIPEELQFPLKNGSVLQPGLAHANLDVTENEFERLNTYIDKDDNRRRFAGLIALFELCFGGDLQWLCDKQNDMSIFTHDHGHYLPPNGGSFNVELMKQVVDTQHPFPIQIEGLLPADLAYYADQIEALQRSTLVDIMNEVPISWAVTNEDLETLGWFLERRRPLVAKRLRDMSGGLR